MPHYKLVHSFLITLPIEWSAPLSHTIYIVDNKRNNVHSITIVLQSAYVVNNFASMTNAGINNDKYIAQEDCSEGHIVCR